MTANLKNSVLTVMIGLLAALSVFGTENRGHSFSRHRLALLTGPGFSTSSDTVNHATQLQLNWSSVSGASEYDIEWTTVDSGNAYIDTVSQMAAGTSGTLDPAFLNLIFLHNASRVTTTGTSYQLSLPYNDDYILLRIRQVQYSSTGIRLLGDWSYSKTDGRYAVWGLKWYQENLNWQYSSAFAEEGKKKEVVSYFDGTLRGRQTVTINNSDNVAVVQENVYDDFGRAIGSILPAPYKQPGTTTPYLHYFSSFNINAANVPYNSTNINGLSDSSCEFNPDTLKSTAGAALYYSHQNPFIADTTAYGYKRFDKYIPDAEGYPLSVTKYTADNTGRIKIQGGVGKVFQPGYAFPSRTSKYYYGKPEQFELDQLFGNDVGYASHYLKNMVVDPNGQISISYINASGKTIATALTGEAPASMDSLVSSVPVTVQSINLLDSSKFIFDNSALKIAATTTYLASVSGPGKLKYSVEKLIDNYPGGSQAICSNCHYDLTIRVYNDCNMPIDTTITNVSVGSDTSNCADHGLLVDSLNVNFPQIGEYYISMELAFSKTVMENYVSNFVTKGQANGALKTQFDFILPYLDSLDFKSCLSDCTTCLQILGTEDHFKLTVKNKLIGLDVDSTNLTSPAYLTWVGNEYTTLKAYCDSLHANCATDTTISPCDQYQKPMEADVSPGGQYALFDSKGNPLELQTNVLYNYWRTVFPVTGTDSTLYKSTLVTLADGTVTSPYASTFTLQMLVTYWNLDWADKFLKYHPEYCKLQFCMINVNSELWDTQVQNNIVKASDIPTIPGAPPGFHYDYTNGAWLLAADPFFKSGALGASYKTSFQNDLLNYTHNVVNNPAVSVKDLVKFVDYLTYCANPAGNTNTVNDPNSSNWDNCSPSAGCRAPDVEWTTYKQFYLQLKEQYYEKARAATTCANQCVVGTPISMPTNSPCPAATDFTINNYSSGDGTPSVTCDSTKSLMTLAYSQGKVGSAATVTIRYSVGTDTTGLQSVFHFIAGDSNKFFCVPDSIPPQSISIQSVVCASCGADPLLFNTWANDHIIQNIYNSSGTIIERDTLHIDSSIYFNGTLTINPDNTYNVNTSWYPYSGNWEVNDSCQFALYSNNVRYTLYNVSGTNLSLGHREGNTEEVWYYNSTGSSVTCTTPDTIHVTALQGTNSYFQGVYPSRHLITVIAGSPGTPPPFTCVNAGGIDTTSTSAYHTCLSVYTPGNVVKYQNVWVFNCVYDNVSSSCPAIYLTKQARFSDISTQVVAPDTSSSISTAKTQVVQQVQTACDANAVNWMAALAPGLGGYSADTATLKAKLLLICYGGGDFNHAFGASSLPSGQTISGGYASFGDVIKGVLGLSHFTSPLNPWLINDPYPYAPPKQQFNSFITNSSPEICNLLQQLQSQCDAYNTAHGTSLSLYNYLVLIYGKAMIMSAADLATLQNSCSTCKYILPNDISLPVFMDPAATGCINPAAYSTAKTNLGTQFGGTLTTSDPNYQTIFTNFMNQRWGFTLTYDQYTAYDTLLTTNPAAILCNQVPQSSPVIDSLACIESQLSVGVSNGMRDYDAYIEIQKNLFRASYISTCSAASANMNLSAPQKTYHYTLYYYDQADNLVRTVPPEGVTLLSAKQIAYVDKVRNNDPSLCTYTGPTTNANPHVAFLAVSSTLSASTGAVEMWLYGDSSTYNHLVQVTVDKKYLFQLSIYGNQLAVDIYPANQGNITNLIFNPASIHYRADISAFLPLEPFSHVVIQGANLGTAATAQIYLNGIRLTVTTANTPTTPGFVISGSSTAVNYPDSIPTLKHLRVYTQPLSAATILANANNSCFMPTDSSHMTGWFRFNVPAPGGPTTINDTSTVETQLVNLYPLHTIPTKYAYNSTNQVSTQQSPDGGINRFWYDLLSRLVISQNDKQLPGQNYSYTTYDAIGRITEVGQKNQNTIDINQPDYLDNTTINSFLGVGINNQITDTYYDSPVAAGGGIQTLAQNNLRKRVALTTYKVTQADDVTQATYYDYDLDGNVKNLYQQIDGLGTKRINYEYDLISGKVNFVAYQDGQPDKFYYQYQYDADNRITQAWSSPLANMVSYGIGSTLDNTKKRLDASYQYYKHGPLARMELGNTGAVVQGVDYAYTLQGWLKGVNAQDTVGGNDMGRDGLGSTTVARDAYGYSLGYYTNDYKPIGGSAYSAFAKQYTQATGDITGQSLYNGNISTSTYFIGQINGNNPVGYTYHYDQLNRIKGLRQHSAISTWNAGNINGGYQENFTYDGNGNILTLNRAGATSSVTDVLAYQYNRDSNGRLTDNKLNYLNGTGNATKFGPPQSANNYTYDPIGNLAADNQAEVSNIQWSVYGKIQSMTDSTNTITYTYNTAQQRIAKQVKGISTWYVRDAQGNPLAVYDNTHSNTNWREQHLYGSSRIGMWTPNMNLATNNAGTIWDTVGHKNYELSNHLGNVVATITDKRLAHTTSGTIDYYLPSVATAQDYYAFGALMPGRSFTGNSNYRYGFNGKENDNEVKGVGNQQDYGMRIYDNRIGRFLSVDPLIKQYPELTPYQFASNGPIQAIDLDGREFLSSNESTVEFVSGILRLKVPNLSLFDRNQIIVAQQDPNQWTVTDGKKDMGVNLTIGNINLFMPKLQGIQPHEIPSSELPNLVTGQNETGVQAEAYNRAGRREIERNGPIVDVPSGRGVISNGAAILDFANLVIDEYKIFTFINDKGKIEEHTKIAQNVNKMINSALKSNMIPVKYQNPFDLSNIMNVILQGSNNTNNKEIYDLGMKIYNKYHPKPKNIVVPTGLDAQPNKPVNIPPIDLDATTHKQK